MKKGCKKIDSKLIFLACIFVIGLLAVFPYGAHLDQTSEQEILYSNIKVYARLLGGNNTLYQNLDAADITDITESIEKDHGMAVFYPMAWIFVLNKISSYAGNIIWHGYIYMLSFCGIVALFYLLSDIYDKRLVPVFTTLLFFFTPRMFAESHYNNKDIILLSLVLCIVFFGWRTCQKKTWINIIGFALAGSLAANMKIIGAFIWGMTGIYILLFLLHRRQIDKNMLLKIITCILLWFCFYLLITPACWTGLVQFWQYLLESARNFRWNDYVLFAGKIYGKNTTGIPKTYLPTMIVLTVPIGILLLAGAGVISFPFSLVRSRSLNTDGIRYLFVMVLVCLIPLGYAVLSGTPVYNGWRHFYFTYTALLLSAAQGISWLLDRFESSGLQKYLIIALGTYVFVLTAGIAIAYPHEYAYYNILAGKNVMERYELDYWDMAFKQAYEIILPGPDEVETPNEKISIGTISNPAYWGLEEQLTAIRGKRRMYVELCADFREAEYLIINPTYAFMYGNSDYEYVKENYVLTNSITSYGNVICEIYHK
ncbi:MAG: hypothetical protein HFH87_03845 [Lachnospiraceae bacterium]|nr:hypothetical protein [Lachnospiraceae bacterium]